MQEFDYFLVDTCRPKQGCSLNLAGIQPTQRKILDCDKYIEEITPDQRLCDYIIYCESGSTSVSVIEMKSGTFHANQVIEQVRNGASLAESWLKGLSVGKFLPLLLHGKGINTMERRIFGRKASQIYFRGKPEYITFARSGSALRDLLSRIS